MLIKTKPTVLKPIFDEQNWMGLYRKERNYVKCTLDETENKSSFTQEIRGHYLQTFIRILTDFKLSSA